MPGLKPGRTHPFFEAGQFTATIEKRQALKIACQEEVPDARAGSTIADSRAVPPPGQARSRINDAEHNRGLEVLRLREGPIWSLAADRFEES